MHLSLSGYIGKECESRQRTERDPLCVEIAYGWGGAFYEDYADATWWEGCMGVGNQCREMMDARLS